jgi:hypothetical protein
MNELEKQLRSWAPRPPSASLEKRLFRRRAAEVLAPTPFKAGWLAPAAAFLVLGLMLLGQRSNSPFTPTVDGSRMVAIMVSNQSYAAYLSEPLRRDQNSLRNTLEWTNDGSSSSSMRFLSPMKAND